MNIEIRKTEFVNKGAELMLYAILEKLRKEFPEAKFCMAPHPKVAPYKKRIELGLYQKPSIWKYNIEWAIFFNLIPKFIREMYGIILDKEIDVVLDAAGFAYGKQFKIDNINGLAYASKIWKKNKTKVILLPQAFGPFEKNSENKINEIISNCDLIFARDEISYNSLTNISGKKTNVKMAPDFTNLINGTIPSSFKKGEYDYCIIPNNQMLVKPSEEEKKAYIPFLIKCVNYLIKNDKKVFILVHESDKDLSLANKINENTTEKVTIIQESNPLHIKGIIGTCEGVISSRFHGLVSALSQGVPAISTGWSHKYEMLFKDYNFQEGTLNILKNDDYLHDKINLLINNKSNQDIKQNLINSSRIIKEDSTNMWNQVIELIKKDS